MIKFVEIWFLRLQIQLFVFYEKSVDLINTVNNYWSFTIYTRCPKYRMNKSEKQSQSIFLCLSSTCNIYRYRVISLCVSYHMSRENGSRVIDVKISKLPLDNLKVYGLWVLQFHYFQFVLKFFNTFFPFFYFTMFTMWLNLDKLFIL